MKCLYLLYKVLSTKEQTDIHKTAQKLKFSIKNFFCKCDQIHRKLCGLSGTFNTSSGKTE